MTIHSDQPDSTIAEMSRRSLLRVACVAASVALALDGGAHTQARRRHKRGNRVNVRSGSTNSNTANSGNNNTGTGGGGGSGGTSCVIINGVPCTPE